MGRQSACLVVWFRPYVTSTHHTYYVFSCVLSPPILTLILPQYPTQTICPNLRLFSAHPPEKLKFRTVANIFHAKGNRHICCSFVMQSLASCI